MYHRHQRRQVHLFLLSVYFLVLISSSFCGWCIRHSSMKEQTVCLQMVKMNGSNSSVFTFTHPHLAYSNRFRPSTWKRYNEGETIASLKEHALCYKNIMYGNIVLENIRFRPSTRKRESGFFKNLHSGERFNMRRCNFGDSFHQIHTCGRYDKPEKKISVNSNKTDIIVDMALVVWYWPQLFKRWMTLSTW